MVQRKVPNKLGINYDHDKSEQRLGNLKQVNPQYQDGRNRGGTDLKKKMKKSGSIKLSDVESLISTPLKQNTSLPGKPPPTTPEVPATATIQPKQSMVKTSVGSPNYMKSTSSSDARKERNQLSPRITQIGSDDSKRPGQKNPRRSRADSSSGNKPTRTLTRSSSLKLARTLKKTPSFKYARSSAKKCSKVALCTDINAQRATCSSTLKDSKFPAYLMLTPGGTELEGTSVMKVCPYTYCSLNGHFHAPLPPLKCFLSAKRRLLKAQKIMKLEALSQRANALDYRGKEIYTGTVVSDGKPASREEDLGSSAISPLIRDGSMEFFVEIYAKDNSAAAETSGIGIGDADDQEKIDSTRKAVGFNDLVSSVGGISKRTEEYLDEQHADSLSYGSPKSEIDFEDSLDKNIHINLSGMDTTESYEELEEEEGADKGYPFFLGHGETTEQYSDNESDGDKEHIASGELDTCDSDASDMEWEEGQFTASYFDYEGDNTTQTDGNNDMAVKSDDAANNGFEEIAADEVLQEACEEQSTSFELQLGENDSCLDGMYQDSDEEFSQASDNKADDQLSFPKDAFKGSTAVEEKDRIADTDEHSSDVIASASMEDPNEELTASTDEKNVVCVVQDEIINIDPQCEDDETSCTTAVADDAFLINHQENEVQQDDDANGSHENQTTDFSLGFNATDEDGRNEDPIHEQKTFEGYQIDEVIEKNGDNEAAIDERLLPKTEDAETTPNDAISDFGLEQQLPQTETGDAIEKSAQLVNTKSLSDMHTSEPSKGCSEAKLEDPAEDDTESHEVIRDNQDDVNAEDCELDQHFVDGSLLSTTQDQASDRKLKTHKDVENQNHVEKDHVEAEKCKSSNYMDSEEQGDFDMHICTLAESSTGKVDDMKMDDNDMSDAAETCLSANTSEKTGNATFNAGIYINQEQPSTCNNLKVIIRSKTRVMDGDEARNFNPREPNYLPVSPDPEAEKVDLRHQMEDERKNAEEWMLDYALRQAVTKLTPARSRRVALLVEAFETVKPIQKYETRRRHTPAAFTGIRSLQTCI